ncbi:uromodulin-like 1 [Pelobates fuscus]|uniref:uromodulin-like 1 n=1 Tax=Pelobates fuscus TaxID=191477 RepID=UPI002FE4A4ED
MSTTKSISETPTQSISTSQGFETSTAWYNLHTSTPSISTLQQSEKSITLFISQTPTASISTLPGSKAITTESSTLSIFSNRSPETFSTVSILETSTPSPTKNSNSPLTTPSACDGVTVTIQLNKVTSDQIILVVIARGESNGALYNVSLSNGTDLLSSNQTQSRSEVTFVQLKPSFQYQVFVQQLSCPHNDIYNSSIWTAGVSFSAKVTINEEFNEQFKNISSAEYKNFTDNFIQEVTSNLDQKSKELVNSGKMRIDITSIEQGSVVVNFSIATDPAENLTLSDISTTFSEALENSTLQLDSFNFTETDICVSGQAGCSQFATCTSYSLVPCQCLPGYSGTSPSVPGRFCEGFICCGADFGVNCIEPSRYG